MERGAGLLSIPQKGGRERGRRTIAPDRLEGPGGVGDKQVQAPSRIVDGKTPVSWTMTRQFDGDQRTIAQDIGSRFEGQKITRETRQGRILEKSCASGKIRWQQTRQEPSSRRTDPPAPSNILQPGACAVDGRVGKGMKA